MHEKNGKIHAKRQAFYIYGRKMRPHTARKCGFINKKSSGMLDLLIMWVRFPTLPQQQNKNNDLQNKKVRG